MNKKEKLNGHTGTNPELKLTSVKIHEHVLDNAKRRFIETKQNLQKVVNRTLYLYDKDVDFRNKIHMCTDLVPSGSL